MIAIDFVDLLLYRLDLSAEARRQVRQNTLVNISTCLQGKHSNVHCVSESQVNVGLSPSHPESNPESPSVLK